MRMDNEPQIMIFHPTMEEFKDMIGYITYMESQGAHKAGVAKIIPPKEWKPIRDISVFESDRFNDVVLQAPIKQEVIGDKGIGLSLNQVWKPVTVKEFRKMANGKKYAPPMDFFDFEDLERKYWSNIHIGAPIYGADVSGSLSDTDLDLWNIAHLPGILTMVEDGPIPGVTTPYLYYGMWKAGFAWHTEDLDLYSINYVHYGAPKQWYSVPPKYGWKLEAIARSLFHVEYTKCKQFLRHKQCFISPPTLKEHGVPVRKVIQECGEIMITFPYGYHAGFNLGFNVAESTNFATQRWIRYGLAAKICRCKDDTVRINMEPFITKYLSDKEMMKFKNGEPFIHPEDPNGTAIMRRNEACSRKRKRAQAMGQTASSSGGTREESSSSSPPDKVLKTTGCGRRRLHVTMEDDDDDTECANKSIDEPVETKPQNGTRSPRYTKKAKHKNSLHGTTKPPKFLKSMSIDRSWMWTYGDEERTDEEMEKVFEEEKSFNSLIGAVSPYCCVCAFSIDIFASVGVLKKRELLLNGNIKDEGPRREFSEPVIPESAFFKGPGVAHYNPNHYTTRESRIIKCSACNIVVHARCYGCTDLDAASNNHDDDCDQQHSLELKFDWICERCEDKDTRACCCLCPIRGGALKRTSCGRWAHIMCIIACDPVTNVDKAVRFGDVPNRTDIIIEAPNPSRRRFRCGFCRTNRSGHLASCCYRSCTDYAGCHIFCSYLSLSHMETGNHPHYFSFTCKCRQHRDIYEKLAILQERQNLAPLPVGSPVLVEDTANRCWYTGVVTKHEIFPEICRLEFPAGQVSSDTPTDYVTRIAEGEGALEYGERVNVQWDDGNVYVAMFLETRRDEFYEVNLDISGKVMSKLSRIALYGPDDTLLKDKKMKIIGVWPPNSLNDPIDLTEIIEDESSR